MSFEPESDSAVLYRIEALLEKILAVLEGALVSDSGGQMPKVENVYP